MSTKPNLDGVCVLVDGGCLNNNKPVSERKMYGSLTVFHNGRQVQSTLACGGTALVHRFLQHPDRTNITNNQSELDTLHAGLLYVSALRERTEDSGRHLPAVTVMSDSEFALGMASGAMKLNAKSHAELHAKVAQIRVLAEKLPVIFQHVDNRWVKEVLGH
jgi:ribonuclease HI